MNKADRIIAAVCQASGVSRLDLLSRRQAREVARPRQLAMVLMCERTGMSLPQIGRAIGDRDHSTVIHARTAWAKALAEGEPGAADMQAKARAILDDEPAPSAPAQPAPAAATPHTPNPAPCEPAQPTPPAHPDREPVVGVVNKRVLRALHACGAWADRDEVAYEAHTTSRQVNDAIHALIESGHVRRETKPGRVQRFTAIRDVTGTPRTPTWDARYPDGKPPAVRRCNRCRQEFQPEHRTNFRCQSCQEAVRHSESLGAAPGMELIG